MTKEEISRTNDINNKLIQSNKIVISIVAEWNVNKSKSKKKVYSINKKNNPKTKELKLKNINIKKEIKQIER